MIEVLHFYNDSKIRLDELLRKELPARFINSKGEANVFSNSKIRRLIVAGAVSVNNRVVTRPAFELKPRSDVCVKFDKEKFFFEKQPDDIAFEVTSEAVLYEDEDFIFINKPAFFPVEQTITGNRDNLHDAVVRYLWSKNPALRNPPYAGIMHRLDRETSGVILFTKNRDINKKVSEIFQSHSFTKKYFAVVSDSGKKLLDGDTFSVEMYMARVSAKSQAAKWGQVPENSKDAQYSRTDFKVLRSFSIENHQCFLVECNLFTGRTHQIRVHLSSKGFPILGDTLYGGQPASRIYLHSCELTCDLFSVKSKCPW
ncbi:MAG: RluA family pseudouridine synthase [Treponema sp.]|nr:RluA family pseudouridine synthase [Treponema sp.]